MPILAPKGQRAGPKTGPYVLNADIETLLLEPTADIGNPIPGTCQVVPSRAWYLVSGTWYLVPERLLL